MFKQEVQQFKAVEEMIKILLSRGMSEADITKEVAKMQLEFMLHPMKYYCQNLVNDQMTDGLIEASNEAIIFTILATCGNRIGKTTWAIHVAGNLIWGPQCGWFDLPLFRHWPYPKNIWLITTSSNLKENYFNPHAEASFYNIFRDKEWFPYKDGKPWYSRVEFPGTDWSMSIYTYNQAAKEFESAQVGIMWLDEPCPYTIWKGLPSRMDKGGMYMMPQTPVDIEPYILTEVIKKAEKKVPGFRHIEGDARQVTTDKERGHYSPEALAAQRSRYTQDEDDARVKGKILYFKEKIVQGYNEDIHFVDPADYPLRSDYLFYHIFDPHDARPNAEIWGAVTPIGRRIVFAERPFKQDIPYWDMLGGEIFTDHIANVEFYESQLRRQYGIQMTFERIADYHFANQTRGVRKTKLVDEYMSKGWYLWNSYTSKKVGETEYTFGLKKLQQQLTYLPDGKPGFVVYKTCFHTNNAAINAIRKRPRTEADLLKPAGSGNIVTKYIDFIDLLRYFACHDISMKKKERPQPPVNQDDTGYF